MVSRVCKKKGKVCRPITSKFSSSSPPFFFGLFFSLDLDDLGCLFPCPPPSPSPLFYSLSPFIPKSKFEVRSQSFEVFLSLVPCPLHGFRFHLFPQKENERANLSAGLLYPTNLTRNAEHNPATTYSPNPLLTFDFTPLIFYLIHIRAPLKTL